MVCSPIILLKSRFQNMYQYAQKNSGYDTDITVNIVCSELF